ncbi:hypothetical protein JLK41_04600 [Ectopseudomonas khazarica]|uniref:hypothetical protein n=1 Tax=Ectopseudomonas khazarica TaxID=2502979 RepID=UPI000B2DE237|nr:hypothetical protein [Pseudomonas khazarica]QTS87458.1 hypothetical protein JLK41_04600 [Pseudomonas khazarica]
MLNEASGEKDEDYKRKSLQRSPLLSVLSIEAVASLNAGARRYWAATPANAIVRGHFGHLAGVSHRVRDGVCQEGQFFKEFR